MLVVESLKKEFQGEDPARTFVWLGAQPSCRPQPSFLLRRALSHSTLASIALQHRAAAGAFALLLRSTALRL